MNCRYCGNELLSRDNNFKIVSCFECKRIRNREKANKRYRDEKTKMLDKK